MTKVVDRKKPAPASKRVSPLRPDAAVIEKQHDLRAPHSEGVRVTESDVEITLVSHKQITLRCGKASITLRPDGQIEIRGTDLTSRAAGQNLVRGASISLN
jgi:uncharacterized protein (DUF2345 family)